MSDLVSESTVPPVRYPFEYALLRVVPRIERGESLNAGVVLYSRPLDFLGARVHLDVQRLHALDPAADAAMITAALEAVHAHCAPGQWAHERVEARHAAPAGREDRGRRFRRLTAPRSTIVQAGPVHTGLTADPEAELEHLLTSLVLPLPH